MKSYSTYRAKKLSRNATTMRPRSSGYSRRLSSRTYLRSLQHLQDRRIGRRPADAELFHALDQRGLGIARRRLGEMLVGRDRALGQRLAARSSAAGGALPRRRRIVVAAFLIEREEAVELDHRAGGAQFEEPARRPWRRCRRWCARARPIPSGSRRCAVQISS